MESLDKEKLACAKQIHELEYLLQSHQKQVQELLSTLEVEENPFPKTMGLNDQGLFILGYYQQTQASYTKKEKEEE